jgi:hypothetical protein
VFCTEITQSDVQETGKDLRVAREGFSKEVTFGPRSENQESREGLKL